MKYHIAISPACDLEATQRNTQAGLCPSHAVWEMSQILGAKVYQPQEDKVLPIDKMRANIIGSPENWALARQLQNELQEDDVIYCCGEHIGFPIAACAKKHKRPQIIVYIHNSNRLRSRLALKQFDLANRIDLFVTTIPSQAEFIRYYLGLPENRVYLFSSLPIDVSFFTPGLPSYEKLRPVVGSGGLEKRDYRTLADATKDLDIDVRVCAFSPNAYALRKTFPKVMPSNMLCRFYDWCELVQLYRDSDVVAISLFKNNYQAGLTTMFEAMACRRPVIITRSPGIISDLIESGAVTGVHLHDSIGLKQAIVKLLNDPQNAEKQAQRGYEMVLKQFNQSNYTQALLEKFISTFSSVN